MNNQQASFKDEREDRKRRGYLSTALKTKQKTRKKKLPQLVKKKKKAAAEEIMVTVAIAAVLLGLSDISTLEKYQKKKKKLKATALIRVPISTVVDHSS